MLDFFPNITYTILFLLACLLIVLEYCKCVQFKNLYLVTCIMMDYAHFHCHSCIYANKSSTL